MARSRSTMDLHTWSSQESETAGNAYPAGEKSIDFAAFMALVKETGRFLGSFVAPKNFRPEPAVSSQALDAEMIRDLGAGSLSDFFSLALEGPPEALPRGGRVAEFFPQGPESVRPAIGAIEAEIKRLNRDLENLKQSWPTTRPGYEAQVRPLENLISDFKESRANLLRAARIWPRIKAEALAWPKDIRELWRKAGRFEDVVAGLVKSARGNPDDRGFDGPKREGRERRSLMVATADLKTEVEAAKTVLADGARWFDALEALLTDLDNLMAVVVDGAQADRDWRLVVRKLGGRLSDLEREERRLKSEAARVAGTLSQSLQILAETEASLAGQEASELLERIESVGRGTLALWRSTIERRREMGRVYFSLPARIGRPVFLEKSFLASALILGRTQALLEDLRHQLSLVGGRLSTTQRLRGEGEALVERLTLPQQRLSRLKLGRRRLASLTKAVEQRVLLIETRDDLDTVRRLGRDTHREMVRGRSENNRMRKELAAAALEKDRLLEQLSSTRQGLGEIGLFKARLLKVYNRKTELLNSLEQERRRLAVENEELKTGRTELRRKRSKLADLYAGQRVELKKIKDEVRDNQQELALAKGQLAKNQAMVDERRAVEAKLDQTRRERDALNDHRLKVEEKLRLNAKYLAAATAKVESLAAEVARHKEELTEANRLRLGLGEKISALRRRLDLVAQAHDSLLKTLRRRDGQLAAADAEKEVLTVQLTRQKRSILRLVAVRQQLRAELGASRLKLSDLETERDDIYARLETALSEARDSSQEKDILAAQLAGVEEDKKQLASQLGELEAKVTDDLTPFIKILGEALWRSEAQVKQSSGDSGKLLEQFRFESDVREANLRLKAAAREIEITETAEVERRLLENNLYEKEVELAETGERLTEIEGKAQGLEKERDLLATHNVELSETISRLDSRTQKLRSALETMKKRFADRLDDARLTETDLRSLVERQGRDIEDQRARLARLEPLIDHFFTEAAEALPLIDDASGLDLAGFLKDESRALIGSDQLGSGQPVEGQDQTAEYSAPGLDERLAAKLTQLRPLVAFLSKSFVANVGELAQAKSQRDDLVKELDAARAWQDSRTQSSLEIDLAQANEDREFLTNQLAQATSIRSVLEASLQSREAELVEMRSEAFVLAQDREQYHKKLAEKEEEITLLKSELAQADRDLADHDGRLEASWAALNYLGTRAGDRLGEMKNRLDDKARQVDAISLELKRRDTHIRDLEDRQDKLALLYWTLISKAVAAGPESSLMNLSLPTLPPLAAPQETIPVWRESASSAITVDGQADQAHKSGGNGLGKGLLDGVKKVARRSLFTLIMAGGLVMAGTLPATAETAAELARDLGGYVQSTQPEEPHLVSRLESNYIGRPVGLELISSDSRLAGRPAVEKRLAEMVEELAAGHGLTNGEFLRLLRVARGPEKTVHLADFEGRKGGLALLEPHFPKMTRHLRAWSAEVLTPRRLTLLLKFASDFKSAEGGFWERLFFDFLSDRPQLEALDRLLDHLQQKDQNTLVKPEYAGRLAPLSEIENMGPDSFINFMAEHIKSSWPDESGKPRALKAKRLAGDLYFSSRLFKLPVTFVAALAHQQAEDGQDFSRRGSTCALHTLTAELAFLTRESGLVWQEDRPPLCDLDEVLMASEGPGFIEEVYRKKMSLVMAYNRSINVENTLLPQLSRRRV